VDTLGLISIWVESLDYKYEILPSCTHYLSPRSKCERCLKACDEKAISFVNGKPKIDDEKCVECGICLSACPVQAIAGIFPKRTIVQNQLVVDAQRRPTVKELLILYKRGIKKIIGESSSLMEQWRQPIDQANALLEQLGEAPFSVSIKSVEQEYYSRRELFSLWKRESKSLLKQAAPAKWRFNHEDLDLPRHFKDYQFSAITVNLEVCTLCKACQRLCEKKCFNINEGEFLISPQACSSCRLCVDMCPEQAISIEEKISPVKNTEYPIYKKECAVCHGTFETLREHDEKCVACVKRELYFKE
jgi:ferredoxin